MTLPAWPEYAISPYSLNDGLSQTDPNPYESSDFEQGEARVERIFRNAATVFNMKWAFSPDGMRIFKAFRQQVGAGKFTMPLFVDADYQTATVQFVPGSINSARDGGEWIVTAQVSTMDQLVDIEGYAIDLFTTGYDGTAMDLADAFHTALHVTWPDVYS